MVATKFVVDTVASPPIVVAKPKVIAPLDALVVKFVSAMVTETTPVFTMVMVPPVVVDPRPAPTATFAAVNDDASVNTLVKLSCILPNAVYRESEFVGLFGAPMLIF